MITPSDIKSRLCIYRENALDMEGQRERIEIINDRMIGLKAQELSGMPKPPSPTHDKWTDLIARKEEIQYALDNMEKHQREEREFFEATLKAVYKADDRLIIRLLYFDCLETSDVIKIVYKRFDDVEERYDSYYHRMGVSQRRAISIMADEANNILKK